MKKLLQFAALCLFAIPAMAQNVPDANFRSKLSSSYGITFDGSNNITNPATAAAKTFLDVSSQNISSLAGIEAFTSLDTLYCYSNQLTSLNMSSNTALTTLYCNNNQLTSLDVSTNTALTTLSCDFNQLTSFDVSANTALTNLYCGSNQLTSLDVSANTALTTLRCYSNQLTNLDVSANTALTTLWCYSNQLTSLDVSANTALTTLWCYSNQLTSLDVSGATALQYLYCYSNQLTSIDVSANTALTQLLCYSNQLTSLDVASNTALTVLYCYSNLLTSLDVSANTVLTSLQCNHNQLANLDISSNTVLTTLYCYNNQLTSLDVSANSALTYLLCYSNQLTSLDVSANTVLADLRCDGNQLTSLNVSANTALTTLVCYSNLLTSLNVSSSTALTSLYCYNNQLTSLDVSANTALTYLYCYSNRIPIVLTDGSVTTINKDAITQVATFRSSAQNPSIASSETGGFVLDTTGAIVNVTANSGASSMITTATGTNPSVGAGLPAAISLLSDKYWTITNPDLTGTYNVIFDLTPFSGITEFDSVIILKRPDAGTAWQNAASIGGVTVQYLEPFVLVNGLTSFSDFAVGVAYAPVNVPDANFRSKLSSSYGITFDGSNNITNPATAAAITSLNVSSSNIADLTGIEAFTGLTYLYCSSNQLTSLDVSANTALTYLLFSINQLTSLDVSANTALTYLDCGSNKLTSLNISANTALSTLVCNQNQLTSLDVSSNIALTLLNCHTNQLTSLDVSSNTALTALACYSNKLTSLNVSSNIALTQLYCYSNQLTSLNVSTNTALQYLYCDSNQLTSLDVSSDTALTNLKCKSNRIPIVLTDGSVTTINKDAITQVATFRSSAQNPSVSAAETGGFVLDTTGAIVNVTANTGASSTITTSTGTNPNVVGDLPTGIGNVLGDKYWTVGNPDLTGTYNLILDLSPLSGITTFEELRILKRPDGASPWQDASTIPGVTVQYLEPFVLVNGLTSFSDFAAANYDATAPAAPQNLMLTAGNQQVTLVWNRSTEPDFARYRIYQGASPGASMQVDSSGASNTDTTKTITGLAAGQTYYFRVSAIDAAANVSDYSNEVSIDFAAPNAPQNLTATAGDGQVAISWRKNTESDFAKYRIYRSTSANAATQIDSSSTVADTSRTYTGLTKGTTYFFRVAAVDNANNQSAYSNEVSATVFAVSPTITTAILQNPALSIYFDVVVVSLSDLASSPSVKLWITGTTDTTSISMSSLSGSPHVYTGAGEFGASGTYNIRTRATTPSGGDTTQTHTYAVTLAKPGVVTKLLALDNMASLQINKTSIKRETYFTAQLNETPSGITYQFGPAGVEFAEALDVEILYDPVVYPDAGKLFVYRKDGEEWTVLRSQVYPSRQTVKTKVTRLGEFKIVYDAAFAGNNVVPTDYALSQNYPNPFNPSTTIRYDLPEDGFLTIKIYNLLGQEVRALVSGDQTGGMHSVLWDGRNNQGQIVASGIYLYRLQTKQFTQTKKMLFIK